MDADKIIIVYFIFIEEDSDWRAIISGQINDLKKYGLLQNSELHLQITDTTSKNESENFVKRILPKATVTISNKNQFEYLPIKKVHELAIKNPGRLLIYFHTKGMSYRIRKRARIEKTLMRLTFSKWKEVVHYLKTHPNIQKAGLVPYYKGKHFWFNFWYAKTDYLATLETPILTDDRYYYEWWLGKTTNEKDSDHNSFSIFNNSSDIEGYDHIEATKIIKKLVADEFKTEIFVEQKVEPLKRFFIRGTNFLKRKFKKFSTK